MPVNTASYCDKIFVKVISLPTSIFSLNSTPIPSRIFLLLYTISLSNLNGGIPKVRRPPISSYLSYTTDLIPFLAKTSAQAKPAGPAPIMPTLKFVGFTFDKSGCHPRFNASSVMYFSILPMVTAPKPSFKVHAPSHNLSCGQILPQISGRELV